MNIDCLNTAFPLAQTYAADITSGYQEKATEDSGAMIWYIAIGVVVAAIVGVVYAVVNRGPAIVNTPLGMLHELCRTHRIGNRGRILLEEISEADGIDHPAILFASPEFFDAAVKKAGKQVVGSAKAQATLGMTRRKIFAQT